MADHTAPDGSVEAEQVLVEVDGDHAELVLDVTGDRLRFGLAELREAIDSAALADGWRAVA